MDIRREGTEIGIRSRILGGGDASVARARRPEALRLAMGRTPAQGLDWLGRPPSARAPLLYRLLVGIGSAFFLGACRLRVGVEGRDRLPDGGYIAVCALHRSWIDPLLVVHALPIEPRVWFLGSGPTAFDRRWKERLLRRTGGILPVWRGGRDIDVHVRAAHAVISEGAVLALFMEGAVGGPPDAVARPRDGSALLALRTGAPIVPIAVCGAEDLYRGKRVAVRVLPPTTAAELLGEGWAGTPEAGSRDEIAVARQLTQALGALLGDSARELHVGTIDPPGQARRWSWLTRLLR